MYRFLFHANTGVKEINIIHTFPKKKLDACDIKMMLKNYELQCINSFTLLCKGDNSEDGVIYVSPTHEFVFKGRLYKRAEALNGCTGCAFKNDPCGSSAMPGRPSCNRKIFVEVK